MSEPLFDIVYTGEIIAPDRQQVIDAFAALFKLDPARAKAILGSSRRVLKKGVSESLAQRYSKKLSEIGVLVAVEPHIPDPETVISLEPESEPSESEPSQTEQDDAVATGAEPGDSQAGDEEEASPGFEQLDASRLAVESVEKPSQGNSNFAAIEDTSKVRRLNFSFTGSGREFFRIWIVNVLLSVVTLGIYSAWAKVRTNRYFYSNTRLENASFEYLADPVKILKGRVIAVLLFLVYVMINQFFPLLSPILGIMFLMALPWMVALGLRFRMRNTGYRNIRFGFEGSMWSAAKAYSLMFLLAPLTLGLLVPYMIYLQNRYLVENTRYGVDHFSFSVSPREYYRIYLKAFAALVATFVVGAVLSSVFHALGAIVVFAGYSLVIAYVKVETLNLMYDHSHLGDHGFSSSLQVWSYFQLYLVNAILLVLTLGLFYPWARVRIARYRAQNLMMLAQGSLNNYVAAQENETSAIAEEVSDIFDFDIGF